MARTLDKNRVHEFLLLACIWKEKEKKGIYFPAQDPPGLLNIGSVVGNYIFGGSYLYCCCEDPFAIPVVESVAISENREWSMVQIYKEKKYGPCE